MSTKKLRTEHLSITVIVLEAHCGDKGPAALVHWSDAVGFAIIAARADWSSQAAAGLADVEPGDRIALTGLVTQTVRQPWQPGELLTMRVGKIEAQQSARTRIGQ